MTHAPPDPDPKLDSKIDIDWLKTLAGALAAVTTAVLLSTLGAAGTLIGAALGSVAATVGTALYSQGLATSRQKVARAQEIALQRAGFTPAEVRPERPGWRDRLAGLPWKRVGLLAGGTFLLVVVVLSAFELLGGKPVSSYTGGSDGSGTSITRLGGSDDQDQDDGDRNPQDQPSKSPSDGASVEPSETPEPTEAPSEAPSETPTQAPTTATPSPTPTSPAPTTPTSPTTPSTSPAG